MLSSAVLLVLATGDPLTGIALPALRMEESAQTLREAIEQGDGYVKFRWRYQTQEGGLGERQEDASLRTTLGFRTSEWKGLRGQLEVQNVNAAGPHEDGLTVAGAEITQALFEWSPAADQQFVAGRQFISRGNGRFLSQRPWAMKETAYDGLTWSGSLGEVLLFAGTFQNVSNRNFLNHNVNGLVVDASGRLSEQHRWTAYALDFDFSEGPSPDNFASCQTLGAHLTGSFGKDLKIEYRLEAASQEAAHDNSSGLDELYSKLELYARKHGFHAGLVQETLGGDGSAAVQVPLGVRHYYNGFTNLMATTPNAGLVDTMLDLGYKRGDWSVLGLWHVFDADQGGLHYGDELNLSLGWSISKNTTLGLRHGSYFADEGSGKLGQDFDVSWIWLETSF